MGSARMAVDASAAEAMPCANWRRLMFFMGLPQGLKPSRYVLYSARLKPRPFASDTLPDGSAFAPDSDDALLFRFDLAGAAEGLPVLFGLVGVEGAESAEGFGECRTVSEIACNDERIA